MKYPRLFEPISVGKLDLPNRMVMPAVHLNHTPSGAVTDQIVEFYRTRARGGVGLIIAGGCAIDAWAGGFHMIGIEDDSRIPGLRRLASACKEEGSKVAVQLYMAGAYAHSAFIGRQAISSSTHVSAFTKEEAREMTPEEIRMVIRDYADAAQRAKEAGFDMVEILAAAGYLIPQFLSPVINRRTDEYGGSIENRMRFGVEVIQAVRSRVGADFCIGVRVAGNDFVPGSHTNVESARFAKAAQDAGADWINVTGGWHETRVPQITHDLPPGGYAYLAKGIRQAVSIPVAASNRINTPELAERILRYSMADLVCMARALIADPEFPAKARSGAAESIRKCVACNQKCFDHVFLMRPVGCVVNPLAGNEYRWEVLPAELPGQVLVVGGGPSGCEAACTAAQRGHKVTLVERSAGLGGQTAWWPRVTGKPEFESVPAYYECRLNRLGVEVFLQTDVQDDGFDLGRFDRILVATGARPAPLDVPGADRPNVLQAWDVLQGEGVVGRNVVIIGGGAVGVEAAVALAREGTISPEELYFLMLHGAESVDLLKTLMTRGTRTVRVIEMLPRLGHNIGPSTRWIALKKLKLFGVKAATGITVKEIRDDGVLCASAEGEERLFDADTVVLAVGSRPEDRVYTVLKESFGDRVSLIGDALRPGTVGDAVEQGFLAGLSV